MTFNVGDPGYARAIDENVDPPETLRNLSNRVPYGLFIREIQREAERVRTELRPRFSQCIFVQVQQCDAHALILKSGGNSETDTGSAPSHYSNLSV